MAIYFRDEQPSWESNSFIGVWSSHFQLESSENLSQMETKMLTYIPVRPRVWMPQMFSIRQAFKWMLKMLSLKDRSLFGQTGDWGRCVQQHWQSCSDSNPLCGSIFKKPGKYIAESYVASWQHARECHCTTIFQVSLDSPKFCENIDRPRENPKCHLILTDGKHNALYKAR